MPEGEGPPESRKAAHDSHESDYWDYGRNLKAWGTGITTALAQHSAGEVNEKKDRNITIN
jgi:hypothetical protein